MKKRSREILLMLADYDRDYRISELADKFQVSQRTIRNDINDINDYLKQQNITNITFGSNGILLVKEDIQNVSFEEEERAFYTYRLSKGERKNLIAAILIQAKGHITLSEIAEMLFVSRATIINDLDGVKRFLKEGKGFGYVYETAGVTTTMKYAFELAANQAGVCFIGTPTKELSFSVKEWENINRKEFTLTGSWMSYSAPFPGKEWTLTAHYFKTGQLKFDESLIFKKEPLSRIAEAFAMYQTPGIVKGKILIDSET